VYVKSYVKKMCLQQFPKNTNVTFSTDVFRQWVPCSGTGMLESTLTKLRTYLLLG